MVLWLVIYDAATSCAEWRGVAFYHLQAHALIIYSIAEFYWGSLDRFRLEFEKLYRALKRSHDHERRLIRKIEELNLEAANSTTKAQTTTKLSQEVGCW